jgi:hypothetical protein
MIPYIMKNGTKRLSINTPRDESRAGRTSRGEGQCPSATQNLAPSQLIDDAALIAPRPASGFAARRGPSRHSQSSRQIPRADSTRPSLGPRGRACRRDRGVARARPAPPFCALAGRSSIVGRTYARLAGRRSPAGARHRGCFRLARGLAGLAAGGFPGTNNN